MAIQGLGSNRDQLLGVDPTARERLINQDVLVGDPRRWRPKWFDGRFLSASDLKAEQNYFLVRQADLGRAGGSGVIDGLTVSVMRDDAGTERLRIDPGEGVTDTGELIVLFDTLQVNPADVPQMERLDAAFGLQIIPNEQGRSRTGLYVLALRPVEWTANPIGAYPTSLTGPRKVEDGTIVEGVAVTLIQYPTQSTDESAARTRARVTREIFLEGRDHGFNSGVLPLAMVALRGNIVEWIDPFLVRRETGAERPAGMDFGFGARALREAHLLQYQRHLADALNANNEQPFSAGAFFDVLPPVSAFPSSTIDADRLTQRFFPPGIEVELSFVAEDELSAIIEESLLLPPLDLTAGANLEGTGVIVLIPLSRTEFSRHQSVLPNWDDELPRLRLPVRNLAFSATPRELLLSRVFRPVAPPSPPAEEQPWRDLLRLALAQPLLWYVRRRHLPISANIAGTPVGADNVNSADLRRLAEMLRKDRLLSERFEAIKGIKAPEVDLLSRQLAARRFVDNPALLKSVVVNAAGGHGAELTAESVVSKLAAIADPALGEGLVSLKATSKSLGDTLESDRVATTGVLVEVDKLARSVAPERLVKFAADLKIALRKGEDLPARMVELQDKYGRTQ